MTETKVDKKKNINVTESEVPNYRKSVLGILGAAVLAFFVFNIIPVGDPATGALSTQARGLVTVFVVALVLWVTEALPIGVTSLLTLVLSPLMGVFPGIKDAATGFTSPVIYFLIATFVLSLAVERSGIGKRFALWLITHSGTGSKTAVLIFMFGCGVVSAIMSNVPACAIFMSLSMPILNKIGAKPGKSNLAKVIMIGLPIASFNGGIATPAGSSINILALQLLKDIAKVEITFAQWMAIGVPLFLIMTVASWWILVKLIPPEVDSIGSVEEFKKEQKDLGKWTSFEKKTMILLSIMIVLWVASSWIKQIDIVMVAIAGAIAMFLPGINLFKWKEIERAVSWDLVLLVGTVTSLGMASSSTGLSKWVVQNTIGGVGTWPLFAALIAINVLIVFIHIPIPINPSIVAAFIPAMVALATSAGVNPAYFGLAVGFTASCAFLLPLDTVNLITYSKGYYKMFDMMVPGFLISIVWVLATTGLLVVVGPLIGL